ncbi:MAG: esterase-like activity of phytase family protein, partial [Epsilonproteobacteria bacterium]|nr:esterase-like activity of phytase family protein [Campylobacterota bacterium]
KKINVRSSNKSVEALTFHPIYKLLFAFEYPPKGVKKCKQKIYSLFFKKSFNLNLIKHKRCAISAIESVDKDHILILERSFGGFFAPFFIDLILYDLKNKSSKLLLELNSGKGFLVDNFEGLAKVGKNRFVMVSDDNNNFFQNTILIYFEISAEALR